MNTPPLRSYVWPAGLDKPTYTGIVLPEQAYAQAMRSLVIVCSDVLPFSRNPDRLWLARRNIKPMDGWWMIGGRWQLGDDPLRAAQRHFLRDAGSLLPESRLVPLGINNFYTHARQQEPQNVPGHSLAFTFGVEIRETEIEHMKMKLAPPEYVADSVTALDWNGLQGDDVHPALRDLYSQIFAGK